jgi:hypothetical protein
MIVVIIMREIGVSIGHTLGLKTHHYHVSYLKRGVQMFLMSYLTILGSNHVSSQPVANSPKSSQRIKKVPHALITYHYALERWQGVSYCFQCHLFIMFFKSVSRGRFVNLNIA